MATQTLTEEQKTKHYSREELASVQQHAVPKHIAIIPDGNRRWAAQNQLKTTMGHQHGSQVVVDLVEAAAALGVQTITLYTFSTENWQRTPEEVTFLMELLERTVMQYRTLLTQHGVRLDTIGDLSRLSPKLQALLEETKQVSKDGKTLNLVLAINYGGRDELCRAVKQIVSDSHKGKLTEIDETTLSRYLDTAAYGDPDLFIRTGSDHRLSNFLPWQLTYTELYFPDVLWPDFSPKYLLEAVREFQSRARRFGS
jgi:undecaprenyl diphosphate synthase